MVIGFFLLLQIKNARVQDKKNINMRTKKSFFWAFSDMNHVYEPDNFGYKSWTELVGTSCLSEDLPQYSSAHNSCRIMVSHFAHCSTKIFLPLRYVNLYSLKMIFPKWVFLPGFPILLSNFIIQGNFKENTKEIRPSHIHHTQYIKGTILELGVRL